MRANALENNVRIYVTRHGERKTFKYSEHVEVELGWRHELRVAADGFTFKVWLNDNHSQESGSNNEKSPRY